MTGAIDWLGHADVPALQCYIDRWWRPGHVLARDADLLRWQYADPQHPGRLSVLAAHEGNEIVGFLGLIQAGFALGGERTDAAWFAMWHATPEAQTRRVGLALLLEALRLPLAAVGCLGMNAHAVAIYERLGFTIVPSLPRWVLPLDVDAFDSLVSDSPPRGTAVSAPAPAQRDRVPTDTSAARWDATWEGLVADGIAGTWRDSSYLRRRYLDHPRFHYHVRIEDDGSALLVYRLEQVAGRPEHVIRIVECLGSAERLAAEAVREHPGAALADFYCAFPPAAQPLQTVGFVSETELPHHVPDRFQPLSADRRGLNGAFLRGAAAPALYCTKSDGDQDRPA